MSLALESMSSILMGGHGGAEDGGDGEIHIQPLGWPSCIQPLERGPRMPPMTQLLADASGAAEAEHESRLRKSHLLALGTGSLPDGLVTVRYPTRDYPGLAKPTNGTRRCPGGGGPLDIVPWLSLTGGVSDFSRLGGRVAGMKRARWPATPGSSDTASSGVEGLHHLTTAG